MKKLFEHSNVTVYWNEAQGYLRLDWSGEIDFDAYKKALLQCLDVVEKHRVVRFLIDQQELEYVGAGPQAWLSVKWFPALESMLNQNTYFAIISSKKLFVRLASQTVSKRLDKSHSTTKYFDTEASALRWLLVAGH